MHPSDRDVASRREGIEGLWLTPPQSVSIHDKLSLVVAEPIQTCDQMRGESESTPSRFEEGEKAIDGAFLRQGGLITITPPLTERDSLVDLQSDSPIETRFESASCLRIEMIQHVRNDFDAESHRTSEGIPGKTSEREIPMMCDSEKS